MNDDDINRIAEKLKLPIKMIDSYSNGIYKEAKKN